MKRFVIPLSLAMLVMFLFALQASAHAGLDHCVPAAGSAVSSAPKQVRCWFTEGIDDKQSILTVADAGGTSVDNGDGRVDPEDPDHKQLVATLKTIPDGVYKVSWHAVTSGDNGSTDGTWYFGVGQVALPTNTPSAGPATAVAQSSSSGAATPAAPTTSAPAIAPTLAVPPPTPGTATANGAVDSTFVVVAGVLEALVIVGVLVYLTRANR